MHFFITVGQHPNRNVNSDVFVDGSPNPEVVHRESKMVESFLRTTYDNIKVVDRSRMVRNNGFYNFVSEYVLQVGVGGDGLLDFLRNSRKVVAEAMEALERIETMKLDSNVWFSGISRKGL